MSGIEQLREHGNKQKILRLSEVHIQTPSHKGFFITTANGKGYKAQIAEQAGYQLLPDSLFFIAEEAGRREDIFAAILGLRVADFHFGEGKVGARDVSGTVQAAVNKAEGAKFCYEELIQQNSPEAKFLRGKNGNVMDNQMVVVYLSGKKVALRKPRKDPKYLEKDIEILTSVMKQASETGAHVEYHSAFVSWRFGDGEEEIRIVRTIMGVVKPSLDIQLMGHIMRMSSHITGGMDIQDLTENVIFHDKAEILERRYVETRRHYSKVYDDGVPIHIHDRSQPQDSNHIVIVEGLREVGHRSHVLGNGHTRNPQVLSAIARGFIELTL
jgi:hypothetical protein